MVPWGVAMSLRLTDALREAVRHAGLLAAAAARPQVTAFGADAYPSFEDKTAALMHSLVRNYVACTVDEAENLMLRAASGQLDVPEIAAWLTAHRAGESSRRGACARGRVQ